MEKAGKKLCVHWSVRYQTGNGKVEPPPEAVNLLTTDIRSRHSKPPDFTTKYNAPSFPAHKEGFYLCQTSLSLPAPAAA